MMDHRGTSIRDLYGQCGPITLGTPEPTERALAYAEAVNIHAVWEVVGKWFGWMQAGEAALKYPDPQWVSLPGRKLLDQEIADKLVSEMDEDFGIEIGRFPRETHLGPDFSRLPPHARLAMAQELWDTIMTTAELKTETKRLVALGEPVPPWLGANSG